MKTITALILCIHCYPRFIAIALVLILIFWRWLHFRIQGERIRTVQNPAIRPIADIDELTDEVLPKPGISRTPSAQFKLPIRQTVMGLAGKVFKKNKNKQEYQSVPSTESMDDINETSQL